MLYIKRWWEGIVFLEIIKMINKAQADGIMKRIFINNGNIVEYRQALF